MKVHPVNLLVAVALAALLTYAITSIDGNTMKLAVGIGSFIFMACTLGTAIGIRFANGRSGVSLRVVGVLFFVVAAVLNVAFVAAGLSQTSYIITSGVLFLLFVLVSNAIYGTAQ